jgi:tetratricopeptide (TPR) repeat protein
VDFDMPGSTKVQLKVMVSSTVRDLPEHRQGVLGACLRQGMFPLMMEHLPAVDDDAIKASLDMVDEADIYLGIIAYRHGYVPKGHEISITEMEYNRAVERGIPRLIFLMDPDHPLKVAQVDTGEGAERVEALRKRLSAERVVKFFKSPEDLRADVITSLSLYHKSDPKAFHYISNIPALPEPYIAHPYILLQSKGLVGRQAELNLLTDWVAKPSTEFYQARILNIVSIGGMGKSALTWKWFNDIAPHVMKPLAGRMWWSFYESDATFENFVTRALAYVTRRTREEVEEAPPPDRETQLLATLDREPYLIVLDGLERILIAYARMETGVLSNDDLDEKTASRLSGALGSPESAAQSLVGQHRLRKTTDPRVGGFLRKLASMQASRILVSTRLFPAELETLTGEPIAGSRAYFLDGLCDDDALHLWREFKVSGTRAELLAAFHTFENHPLLITALAGVVAHFRPAPCDFGRWHSANLSSDLFRQPLEMVRSHILQCALAGLDHMTLLLLQHIAQLRIPPSYDTLISLTVGRNNLFPGEPGLDAALSSLEDRGLLGWDKRSNRYHLHPVVGAVVWRGTASNARLDIFGALRRHFTPLAERTQWWEVKHLEDLTAGVELYNTLISEGNYNQAFAVFRDRLDDATLYSVKNRRQRVALLEMLFPDGLDQVPRLEGERIQRWTLRGLAADYSFTGQPARALALYREHNLSCRKDRDALGFSHALPRLSWVLRVCGQLRQSEAASRAGVLLSSKLGEYPNQALSLVHLALAQATLGRTSDARRAIESSLCISSADGDFHSEALAFACLSITALWVGDVAEACSCAKLATSFCQDDRSEEDSIRAGRLSGAAAACRGDFDLADQALTRALTRARTVSLVEEELESLIALAELRRSQGDLRTARHLLEDVWEPAEHAPYPLLHGDALNVVARIERDEGSRDAAMEAATKAYRLAWCNGPPYAYHWGLEAAKKHLAELHAPEPADLPAFDESKYEPIPEVEINPPDEFPN